MQYNSNKKNKATGSPRPDMKGNLLYVCAFLVKICDSMTTSAWRGEGFFSHGAGAVGANPGAIASLS